LALAGRRSRQSELGRHNKIRKFLISNARVMTLRDL